MVLLFPSPDDRAAVETAVNVFLWTQKASTRVQMLRAARAVLGRYGVSKMKFERFVVEAAESGWAAIRGRRRIDGRQCPGCGAEVYEWPGKVRILSIKEGLGRDIVCYGCRCGSVFDKVEKA